MSQKNSTQTAVRDFVSEYNSAVGAAKVAVRNACKQASLDALMGGDADLATTYAKQSTELDSMSTADKAPAVTRAMLLNRRVEELRRAIVVLRNDDAFDRFAGVGDKWTVEEKRVTDLAKVRTTEKASTYRGATADFIGSVANTIGAGDYTVSAFIKAGFAAGVKHPSDNKTPSGAVGAWMNGRRDETVKLGDVDVTITRNSDGVAILRVA